MTFLRKIISRNPIIIKLSTGIKYNFNNFKKKDFCKAKVLLFKIVFTFYLINFLLTSWSHKRENLTFTNWFVAKEAKKPF